MSKFSPKVLLRTIILQLFVLSTIYATFPSSTGECTLPSQNCAGNHPPTKISVYVTDSYKESFIWNYLKQHEHKWDIVSKSKDSPQLMYVREPVSSGFESLSSFWPLSSQFSNKAHFYRNAAIFSNIVSMKNTSYISSIHLSDVMPLTFYFDMNAPKFTDEEKSFFAMNTPGAIWIKKPVEESMCKGIEVFRDLKEFQNKVGKKKPYKKKQQFQLSEKKSWIVQKYIENSLLIDSKKFDLRSFVLIASFSPYVVLYHPGYIRRSLERFSLHDLDDKFIHCVNQSVQRQHKSYEKNKADTLWSMDKFASWLSDQGQDFKQIDELMQKKIAFSVLGQKAIYIDSANQEKRRKVHDKKFQLFGVDISFDDQFNPFVIEMNDNIHLGTYHMSFLDPLFEKIATSMLEIEEQHVLHQNSPADYFASDDFQTNLHGFTILYNEATNYSVLS